MMDVHDIIRKKIISAGSAFFFFGYMVGWVFGGNGLVKSFFATTITFFCVGLVMAVFSPKIKEVVALEKPVVTCPGCRGLGCESEEVEGGYAIKQCMICDGEGRLKVRTDDQL